MAKAVAGHFRAAATAVAVVVAGGTATVRCLLAAAVLFVGLLGGMVDAQTADVSVTDFGAVGDGHELCTEAFRLALTHVAKAGGGVLRVPRGVFLTGPLTLTSHLVFWLESGARLLADTNRDRLPMLPALPSYGPDPKSSLDARRKQADLRDAIPRFQPLLHGVDLENVTITGENGTLDGQGRDWWQRWLDEPRLDGRPHLVQFERSRGLRLQNVTIVNPGFWSVHLWLCEHVIVRFVTVLVLPWDPLVRPTNTDGINPDSSSHVLIEDSYLQTGDDSVAVKSGWDCFGRQVGVPARNITIRRIVVRQTAGCNAAGVAIGSEMSGGVEDVLIEDSDFMHAGVAVEVKVGAGRGGYVRNVHARDLRVGHTSRAALVVMATYPEPNPFCKEHSPPAPDVRGVTFERVRVDGPTRGHLVQLEGTREVFLQEIAVRDVRGWGSWSCKAVSGSASGNSPPACYALGGTRQSRDRWRELQREGDQQRETSAYTYIRRRRTEAPAPPPPSRSIPAGSEGGAGWRNDGRCGELWPADEGLAGRCPLSHEFMRERAQPSRRYAEVFLRSAPCCSKSGWCGAATEHCNCDGCVDFRREARAAATSREYSSWDTQRYQQKSWEQQRYRQNTQSQPRAPAAENVMRRPARAAGRRPERAGSQGMENDAGKARGQGLDPEQQLDSPLPQHSPFPRAQEPPSSLAGLVSLPMEPPVAQGLITGSMFVLCAFLCGLLVRRYIPLARNNPCFWMGGFLAACIFFHVFNSLLRSDAADLQGSAAAKQQPEHSLVRADAADLQGSAAAKQQPEQGTETQQPQPSLRALAGLHDGAAGPPPAAPQETATRISETAARNCEYFQERAVVTPQDFGGVGDGIADDTDAVRNAMVYGERCHRKVLVGPKEFRFLVRPGALQVKLENVTIRFEGELLGPTLRSWNPKYAPWPAGSCAYGESGCATNQGQSPEFVRSKWSLLHLVESSAIVIEGPGGLTAPGEDFWRVRNWRPEVSGYCLLKLERCSHVHIADLALTDSPMYQVVIMHSVDIDLRRLSIIVNDQTVGDSGPHNTDGVSIISSENVHLRDSEIESGDDNIVIKEGSKRIHVESVTLFRGKGVSIGSLGERASSAQVVTDVVFRNVSLEWSMHGARIKTWIGGKGLVRNVSFEKFDLKHVDYGVLIDQKYCPLSQRPEGCDESDDAPAISIEDVNFKSFSGTYRKADRKVSCKKCIGIDFSDMSLYQEFDDTSRYGRYRPDTAGRYREYDGTAGRYRHDTAGRYRGYENTAGRYRQYDEAAGRRNYNAQWIRD